MTLISLVVPVYNEEVAIPVFYEAVRSHSGLKNYDVEIVFIDDGSKDDTAKIMKHLASEDKSVSSLYLTRNFGKEAALFAGLEHARGDAIIPIDVDLQDPIDIIPKMLAKWEAGAAIVLAKRGERENDSYLKRKTAEWFYKVHNAISTPKIEENVGDFRLMSREVVNSVIAMPERNLFMKGLLSWSGHPYEVVEYKRDGRSAGTTKFNAWKLWNLAVDGLTSFSTAPLKISTYFGLTVAIISFSFGGWLILDKLINGNEVPGYPSIMVSILFFSGVQLIAIGVLGEYIGRIYTEVKNRPRYLLKSSKQIDT